MLRRRTPSPASSASATTPPSHARPIRSSSPARANPPASSSIFRPEITSSSTPLLPSFASGRRLPPLVSTSRTTFSSDPRSYSTSPVENTARIAEGLVLGSGWDRAGEGRGLEGQTTTGVRAPSPVPSHVRRYLGSGERGGISDSRRRSQAMVGSSGSPSRLQPTSPPPPSVASTTNPPPHSSVCFSRSTLLSSTYAETTSFPVSDVRHPSPPSPIVCQPSLRRRTSQVSLDSPILRPLPQPLATPPHAHLDLSSIPKWSSPHQPLPLVRRASLSDSPGPSRSASPVLSGSPRARRSSFSTQNSAGPHSDVYPDSYPSIIAPPPAALPPASQLGLPNSTSTSSRAPPPASTSSTALKRASFSPSELAVLLRLWNAGAYYPSSPQVDSLIAQTGLTRVQVRN